MNPSVVAVLIGEGSTDRALVPALAWLLRASTPVDSEVQWIDAYRLPRARTLSARVDAVRGLQSFDLLFVHRDADNQPPEWRYSEIISAVRDGVHVAVVPVRTTETWLLPHEAAIREACGRPSGTEPLGIPSVGRLERTSDPKSVLHAAMVVAAGARGGRRRSADLMVAFHYIAERVDDWGVLRQLSAFRRLEADTRAALERLGHPLRAAVRAGQRR